MCQAMTPIENGESCTVPGGLGSITCAGERITADENGIVSSKVIVPCACTLDNPIWACQEVVVETRSPSATPLGEVCANLPTPSTGDNCGAVLEEVGLIDRAECMFMQVTTAGSNGQVTSNQAITCDCDSKGLPSKADATWVCDGTFAPIPAPTLMPAGFPQPTSIQPANPNPTPIDVCGVFDSAGAVPQDGDNCAFISQDFGLQYLLCPVTNQTACECKNQSPSSSNVWRCGPNSMFVNGAADSNMEADADTNMDTEVGAADDADSDMEAADVAVPDNADSNMDANVGAADGADSNMEATDVGIADDADSNMDADASAADGADSNMAVTDVGVSESEESSSAGVSAIAAAVLTGAVAALL